jgi:hypothetical protein
LQVTQHLAACLNYPPVSASTDANLKDSNAKDKVKLKLNGDGAKKGPLVSVGSVVGGMSAQKQRRVLDRGVDVLVATPGRLWDILQEVYMIHLVLVLPSTSFTANKAFLPASTFFSFLETICNTEY